MAIRATLTVVGLMYYDNTLFDNFNVPTGMDKSMAIDEITRECGDLELMWPDWDFMKHAIGNWSDKNEDAWTKLYASTQLTYDPIANVDAEETTTRNGKQGGNVQVYSNGGTGGSTTIENDVAAYNSNTLEHQSKQTTSPLTTWNENTTTSPNTNWNDFEKKKRHGNIGVTSTQELIKQEREIDNFNVYDVITQSFKHEFCLCVY